MTDDERFLEIATRLYAADIASGNDTDPDTDTDCALFRTERLIYRWRERTGAREERGQDVSVEMLQRAAVACRSAAAMWSAIPTKSEYWCETADYFDKRARAAGKGEG